MSRSMQTEHDVIVIGASVAGCAAATMLGEAGVRVALVDRRPDPAAFKRVCGHFIQSSGVPVLERLGVLAELERAGAVRGTGRVWTRYGWTLGTRGDGCVPRSLSVRREVLDPVLRRRAAATPGVDLLLGHDLEGLETRGDGGRVATLRRRGGEPVRVAARVVLGADGRGSRTAALAGLPTRTTENGRFAYWGYFDGPSLDTGASVHLWLLEPDVAIATPTDSGLTLYAAFPERSRVQEFKRDPEAALRAFFAALPDAPPIAEARRCGPMVGKLEMANERRPLVGDGVALIGDAALAADPVGAIGCGWALQSAQWLCDAIAPALTGGRDPQRALRRYARRHRRALRGHALLVDQSSRARVLTPPQRLLFSAATRDAATAERLEAFASRRIGPSQLLSPGSLGRAAAVNLRARSRVAGQRVGDLAPPSRSA